jgi:hypothetical protein
MESIIFIWGSHSGDSEGSGLLGYNVALLVEWFPTTWRTIIPSSSRINDFENFSYCWVLYMQDAPLGSDGVEHIALRAGVKNCQNDKASK